MPDVTARQQIGALQLVQRLQFLRTTAEQTTLEQRVMCPR
jgi:hypothetical protein